MRVGHVNEWVVITLFGQQVWSHPATKHRLRGRRSNHLCDMFRVCFCMINLFRFAFRKIVMIS